MKYLSLIFLIVLVGCGEVDKDELKKLNGISTQKEQKQTPRVIKGNPFEQKEKKSETLKNSTKTVTPQNQTQELKPKPLSEAEKIKLEQEANQKKLEAELKKESIKNSMELKKLEQKQKLLELEKKYEIYKIIALIVGVILLLVVLFFYLHRRKKSHLQVETEKEKFHREKDLELYKLQTERFEKVVEVVTSKELSKDSEKAILSVIEQKSEVIEVSPKKKGLLGKK